MSRIHTIAMAVAVVLCAQSASAQAPDAIFKYSGPDRQQKLRADDNRGQASGK